MVEGIVYKYTSPSGKVYIGQTTREVYRRRMWFGSGRHTGGNSKIDRARKKYGPENFIYGILIKNYYSSIESATEDLNRWETYYIGYYDSYRNGYNCTLGGDGSRGYKPTVETRVNISKSLKGKKKPVGFGTKVSVNMKGVPKSDSCKRKLSKARKSIAKQILQFTLEGTLIKVWDNIDAVSKNFNCSRETVAACCRGKRKTALGFTWKYKK